VKICFAPVVFLLVILLTSSPSRVASAPSGSTGAAPDVSAPAIRLRTATFVPSLGQKPALRAGWLALDTTASRSSRTQYLVQFRGPIHAEWRIALEATGVSILGYIPDYAYKIEADSAALSRAMSLSEVLWIGIFQPGYRLSPEVSPLGRQLLRLELDASPKEDWLAALPRLGIHLVGQEGRTLLVEAEPDSLATLASADGIQWIAPATIAHTHNDRAAGEIRADLAQALGYAGRGQTINIADTGLDTGLRLGPIHSDVAGRVDYLRSWPISSQWGGVLQNPGDNDGAADLDTGHGTHVAGSALGNGAASGGVFRGVAPEARLTFQALEQYCSWFDAGRPDGYYLVGIPADLSSLYAEAYGWGARIDSNSWGNAGMAGVYNVQSQQTDRFVWEHRDMTILFSAGNGGRDLNGDGLVELGSIEPPATAKNVIAVGAVENRRPEKGASYGQFFGSGYFPAEPIHSDRMADAGANGMMATSARGPTLDGRLAPQVVAPGSWVASLRSSQTSQTGWGAINSAYMYDGGTSMSTPLVAGGVALLRQAYMARGHTPSAALVKATLIQTARDIPGQYAGPYNDAGPIPNNQEGWGAVDLQAAVADGRRFVDETMSLQTGEETVYTFALREASAPSRFTLVWTDYPAAVEAAAQLVNDLDLQVTAPNGQTYYGNVFAHSWSTLGGRPDRLNNVECVYLPSTQAGTYTVTVFAANVPWGPQDFALLVGAPFQQTHLLALPLVLRNAAMDNGAFRDDFETISGMWPITATATYTLSYGSGEYAISVAPAKHKVGALPAVEHAGDMILEVDGHAANATAQAYGLLFNYGEDAAGKDYCAFLLAPSGYYAVARWHDEVEAAITDGWISSTAILTGSATNHLTVRRVGEQVSFLVNDRQVFAVGGPQYATGAGFGLIVLSYGLPYAEAHFDNYAMIPLVGSSVRFQNQPGLRLLSGGQHLVAPPGFGSP
jgi:serine protease AprX